eukprot:3532032-Ditylum_brightwellii.AAC.1
MSLQPPSVYIHPNPILCQQAAGPFALIIHLLPFICPSSTNHGSAHYTPLCPIDTLASQLYMSATLPVIASSATADILLGDTTSAALLSHIIHPEWPLDAKGTTDTYQRPCVVQAHQPRTHSCPIPKCTSCILAKTHWFLYNTTYTKGTELGKLTREDLQPGNRMSLDQYVVKHKSCTLCTTSNISTMYNGGTIFTDHASKMIFAFNQIFLYSGETLQGKHVGNKEACAIGHHVKSFHENNHVFTSEAFKADLTAHDQTICFSGVGTIHQNSIAEHNMKTTFYLA